MKFAGEKKIKKFEIEREICLWKEVKVKLMTERKCGGGGRNQEECIMSQSGNT